jgi:hypothetical protein
MSERSSEEADIETELRESRGAAFLNDVPAMGMLVSLLVELGRYLPTH